jgi:nucleotide-binding universal stress UspA family protein
VDETPILICYDGSEDARRAVIVAASLLRERTAVVLDVGPLQMVAGDYVALDDDAMNVDRLTAEDALARAKSGAELAREAGFLAKARSEVDTPTWQGIVNVADQIGAAAIVIGSNGQSHIRELLSGSPSHEVAAHAGRPVLIVPRLRPISQLAEHASAEHDAVRADDMPILICYDGHEGGRRAIVSAGSLLSARRAVVVEIVRPTVSEGYAAAAADGPDVDYTDYEDARARVNDGAAYAQSAGLSAEGRVVVEQRTSRGIVNVADDIGAAAIVFGSGGLTGIRETFHRSLSHQVAARAGRPVLVVP